MPPDRLYDDIEFHRTEVKNYLFGRLGCAETAADLFQSIVENILRRDSGSPINNVRAYLFNAARNAAANHQRAQRSRDHFDQQAKPLVHVKEERTPEDAVCGEQTLNAVNRALSELPVLTQQMFLLYRLHGMKQTDIARKFDVHLSTVEKRIRKAILHCQHQIHRQQSAR